MSSVPYGPRVGAESGDEGYFTQTDFDEVAEDIFNEYDEDLKSRSRHMVSD